MYALRILEEQAVAALKGVPIPHGKNEDGLLVWANSEGGERTYVYSKLGLFKKSSTDGKEVLCSPPASMYLKVTLHYAGLRVSKDKKREVFLRYAGEDAEKDVTHNATTEGAPLFQLFQTVGKSGLGADVVAPSDNMEYVLPLSPEGVTHLRYRVNEVSNHHQKNLFCVWIEARMQGESYPVGFVKTSPVHVTSKDLKKLRKKKSRPTLHQLPEIITTSPREISLPSGSITPGGEITQTAKVETSQIKETFDHVFGGLSEIKVYLEVLGRRILEADPSELAALYGSLGAVRNAIQASFTTALQGIWTEKEHLAFIECLRNLFSEPMHHESTSPTESPVAMMDSDQFSLHSARSYESGSSLHAVVVSSIESRSRFCHQLDNIYDRLCRFASELFTDITHRASIES